MLNAQFMCLGEDSIYVLICRSSIISSLRRHAGHFMKMEFGIREILIFDDSLTKVSLCVEEDG